MSRSLYVFLATLSSFLPAAWLCVLLVRDSLKRPLWLCLAAATVLTIVYALMDILLMINLNGPEYIGVFLYLLVAAFALFRVSLLSPYKLLFLMMMVFSYYCFVVGINWGLDIPQNGYTILYNVLSILFPGIPFYILLRRIFWPLTRDMEGSLYRYLWVTPFAFSLVLTLLANTVGLFLPLLYFAIQSVSFLSALVIYYVLLRTLSEATHQTQEAERVQASIAYLELQAEQYQLLTQSIEISRMLRHDLRHHLLVIKRYAQEEDFEGAVAYCDHLSDSVAESAVTMLCENFAVNAVAAHYYGKALAAGIDMDVELRIGEEVAPLLERDLSVVIGNLLENATEACERIPESKRWLRMRCRMVGDNLTIAMDNSFDGVFRRSGKEALSRKHEGTGIGLASIRAVARKYGGETAFIAKGDIFQSSVYLPMRGGVQE